MSMLVAMFVRRPKAFLVEVDVGLIHLRNGRMISLKPHLALNTELLQLSQFSAECCCNLFVLCSRDSRDIVAFAPNRRSFGPQEFAFPSGLLCLCSVAFGECARVSGGWHGATGAHLRVCQQRPATSERWLGLFAVVAASYYST